MFRKRFIRITALVLVMVLTAAVFVTPSPAHAAGTGEIAIQRISGQTRYDTAAEVSKSTFDTADTVILASGTSYPDALAGVPLATALEAPILLTKQEELHPSTLAEIRRLGAANIYILGGELAVSKSISDSLINEGYTVERISGNNRFETAVQIAYKLAEVTGNNFHEAFFCCSDGYADALSASTIAAIKGVPILYIAKDGVLDQSTYDFFASFGLARRYLVGGTSVISDTAKLQTQEAAKQNTNFGSGMLVTSRISGTSRYDTCLALIKKYSDLFAGNEICYATGTDFPDALAAGVFAATNKMPLMLVGDVAYKNIAKYVDDNDINKVYVIGGTSAISEGLVCITTNDSTNKYLKGTATVESAPTSASMNIGAIKPFSGFISDDIVYYSYVKIPCYGKTSDNKWVITEHNDKLGYINVDIVMDKKVQYPTYLRFASKDTVVKAEPSNSSTTIGKLEYNDGVSYLGQHNSDWAKILFAKTIGYVRMDCLTTHAQTKNCFEIEGSMNSSQKSLAITQIDKLPDDVWDMFNAQGWKLRFTNLDINKHYCENAYEHGVAGLTIFGSQYIVVNSSESRIKSATLHEFGHYFDDAYGAVTGETSNWLSGTIEFEDIYLSERDNFDFHGQGSAVREHCYNSAVEYFAEAFENCILYPTRTKETTPRTYEYIMRHINAFDVIAPIQIAP